MFKCLNTCHGATELSSETNDFKLPTLCGSPPVWGEKSTKCDVSVWYPTDLISVSGIFLNNSLTIAGQGQLKIDGGTVCWPNDVIKSILMNKKQ